MALHCGDIAGLLRVGAVTTAEYLLPPLLLECNSPVNTVLDEVGDQSLIWSSRS